MKTDRHLLEETLSRIRFEDIPTYNSRPSSPVSINFVNVGKREEGPLEDEALPIDELVIVEPEDDVEVIEEMVEVDDDEDLPPNKPDFKIAPTVESYSVRNRGEPNTLMSYEANSTTAGDQIKPADIKGNRGYIPTIRRIKVSRPSELELLQTLLSNAYNSNVDITSIDQLETTRKQVKRVFFLKEPDPWLYQVWVFKADPKETAREMAVYQIASDSGVPTGKPIGYTPNPSSGNYPYDIAVIGGVVEHAGNPYNELIRNLRLKPGRIHDTAVSIAGIIADSHVKLTLAGKEFEKYGITLQQDSPTMELSQRLIPALGINGEDAAALIAAAESLYSRQSGSKVISHCDLHTGNIVTKEMLQAISLSEFGMIDWGTVALDNPYSDLTDFWLHHQRQAMKASGICDPGIDDLLDAYDSQFAISAKALGLEAKPDRKDAIIQSALWNLYEMYDPVRKDPADIEQKARYHCKAFCSDLHRLKDAGMVTEAYHLKAELKKILADKTYLNGQWH